ncbi:MAG: hypothetical protein GY856_30510 [bacterium]|nr:hypothetical protein [bacterium]
MMSDEKRPDVGRRAARRPDPGIRWVRREQEIATRIVPGDLQGLLRRGLEVQPGTRALLFVGGRYVGTLPPGRHRLEGLRERLRLGDEGEASAIVVDDGELGLELTVAELRSTDHHQAIVHAEASIRLADPELFIANLFRDRGRFSTSDLSEFLRGEAGQTLRELVARYQAEELHAGRVRGELEMELLSRWKTSFEQSGFVLHRFRVLEIEVPGLEAAGEARAQAADALRLDGVKRETREAFFEEELRGFRLDTEILRRRGEQESERATVELDGELGRLRRDLDRLERRNPLLKRLQQESLLEKMGALRSDEEWRRFRLQVDRDRLLEEHEWAELRGETEEKDARRRILVERAQAELEELKLKQGYQLKLLEMRGDTEVTEEQLRRERLRLDHELEARRRVAEAERAELAGVRALQLETVEQLGRIHQRGKDQEAARKLQTEASQAEIERKRLAQERETFTAMTPEQILAIAVARHPERSAEIAQAFRGVRTGEADARERELYERLLAEVKAAHEKSQALDHEKFMAGLDAGTRHRLRREALDEQEKDRLTHVAVAGLTADDKKKIVWRRCSVHPEVKYPADSGCPLCAQH